MTAWTKHGSIVLNSLKKRGVGKTILSVAGEYWFDLRFRVNTSAYLLDADFSLAGPHRAAAAPHYGTNWFILKKVFRNLARGKSRPLVGEHLVDFGCGSGRALMTALHFGVGRVTGVEFSQVLCARATVNLSRFAGRDHRFESAWSVVHADASCWAIPAGTSLFFLYNPFGPPVIEAVADNILQHARASGSGVTVVYVNPVHAAVFAQRGFRQGANSNAEVHFYTSP